VDGCSDIGWDVERGESADSEQTIEIARLQIGDDPEQARVLVTNISDAENLLPLFIEYEKEGKQINVSTQPWIVNTDLLKYGE
jgi:D-serine ammonia-lyase